MNLPDLPDVHELARQDTEDGVQQQIVGAIVDHGGEILLLRRLPADFRGGAWEFPSGKVEPGEDLITALHREVAEETALTISKITGYLGAFDYTSRTGRHNRQHTWSVTVDGTDDVRLTEHDAYTWVRADQDHPVSDNLKKLISAHFG
ncbi:NUDIX domain-containing protein [Saccharopolyspora erythraea]|uniref:NUDIX hydrolase n=1 Tax=Saccharopolyspora erythraea TaxID=1836 RepID=UPI001BA6D63D|nr:NUDIX domain-containing protein [Saccharopolyspora erythraea]QUH02766.1 NUDIX domain-containing protein [Saccharopolyspora erythraea]